MLRKCTRNYVLEDSLTLYLYSFVEAMLLFGMGTILTEEEGRQLESVRKPCYAALGLANDCFSFDRESDEFQACDGEAQTFTNSVWLHMKWHKVDVAAAKNIDSALRGTVP